MLVQLKNDMLKIKHIKDVIIKDHNKGTKGTFLYIYPEKSAICIETAIEIKKVMDSFCSKNNFHHLSSIQSFEREEIPSKLGVFIYLAGK
nr:hypothetical protein [uncultured Marinifilum sp.]